MANNQSTLVGLSEEIAESARQKEKMHVRTKDLSFDVDVLILSENEEQFTGGEYIFSFRVKDKVGPHTAFVKAAFAIIESYGGKT